MKKLHLPFLSLFILLTAFTCENEPLDGEFVPEDSATDCLTATQAYLEAAENFVDATDANYTVLCNAYKTALENQIIACGDPTGGFQTLIYSLGDCTSNNPDTCASATAAANVALFNLNNAPADQYTTFCNVYVMALENKIDLCGDADGSIQQEINDLGDCSNQNLILLKKTIWTYSDGSTVTTDYAYNGNRLISIADSEGETETYTYENNLLTRIDTVINDPTGNPDAEYTLLEYDSQNRLINEILFIDDGVQSQRWAYTYNTDGTITETAYFTDTVTGVESLDYTGTVVISNGNYISWTDGNYSDQYTYDNSNGALKNVYAFDTLLLLNGLYISNNNEIANNSTIGGVSNPDDSYSVTYTYNNDDYPLTSNYDYESGTVDDYSVEYFYD
ncbi:hypothetical protein [Olleya sp. YS]|uniref:hypothetical protein n=1 Tax=Olleya sp. YS TaxID=3028318 RepID=UPI0024341F31|nr:hypothetical protein [Olleya sp. YS]WGD34355.1 hypothetical protein Ollyesu_11265 [Olleya sp. YS]